MAYEDAGVKVRDGESKFSYFCPESSLTRCVHLRIYVYRSYQIYRPRYISFPLVYIENFISRINLLFRLSKKPRLFLPFSPNFHSSLFVSLLHCFLSNKTQRFSRVWQISCTSCAVCNSTMFPIFSLSLFLPIPQALPYPRKQNGNSNVYSRTSRFLSSCSLPIIYNLRLLRQSENGKSIYVSRWHSSRISFYIFIFPTNWQIFDNAIYRKLMGSWKSWLNSLYLLRRNDISYQRNNQNANNTGDFKNSRSFYTNGERPFILSDALRRYQITQNLRCNFKAFSVRSQWYGPYT